MSTTITACFEYAATRLESPGQVLVEGDASSASYFLAAAAISGEVTVKGVGTASLQGDVAFADVVEAMGAHVARQADQISVRTSGSLKAIDVDLNHIPDAAMTLATLALFAEGTTCIRNIYNWRIKETDRMTAMATELRKVAPTLQHGRQHHYHPAGRAKTRANRHLRRSSDGHVLFATSHEQRAPSYREPRGHRQNLPKLLGSTRLSFPLTGKAKADPRSLTDFRQEANPLPYPVLQPTLLQLLTSLPGRIHSRLGPERSTSHRLRIGMGSYR